MKIFFNIILFLGLFIVRDISAQQVMYKTTTIRQDGLNKEKENKLSSNHYKDSSLYYNWNEDISDWSPDEKHTFNYDKAGNLINQIYSIWKTNYDNWGYKYKDEFEYTENSELSENIGYIWQTGQNNWNFDYKEINFYSNNGDSVINYIYERSFDLTEWEEKSKRIDIMNQEGQKLKSFGYAWNIAQSDWLLKYKSTYSYDNNQISEIIMEDWDTLTEKYVNDFRYKYVFDSNGNILKIINDYWSIHSNEWKKYFIKNIFYNESDLPIEEYVSFWRIIDYESLEYEWDTAAKVYFIYTSDNLLKEEAVYKWNDEQNEWINTTKRISEYDNNSNMIEQINSSYNGQINDWINTSKEKHFYSILSGISDVKENYNLSIYPNPANDCINIIKPNTHESYTLTIFSLSGEIIYQRSITALDKQYSLDVNFMNSGMYIISISDNHENYTQPLIIE